MSHTVHIKEKKRDRQQFSLCLGAKSKESTGKTQERAHHSSSLVCQLGQAVMPSYVLKYQHSWA